MGRKPRGTANEPETPVLEHAGAERVARLRSVRFDLGPGSRGA